MSTNLRSKGADSFYTQETPLLSNSFRLLPNLPPITSFLISFPLTYKNCREGRPIRVTYIVY